MKFNDILALFLAAALTVVASPIQEITTRYTASDNAAYEAALAKWKAENNVTETDLTECGSQQTAFICRGTNWAYGCENLVFRSSDYNQLQTPHFKIGSFGPGDGVACIWYHYSYDLFLGTATWTPSGTVYKPGSANLGWWTDYMSNFKCWW